jgi:starch phosphorylase
VKDDAFASRLEVAYRELQSYMTQKGWFATTFPECASARLAYFSMEYGIHECLPIYSGGLGVLAGDHLKTASDLGLPLVGIGLAYAEGYFRQALNRDGLQQERYPTNDWSRMPVSPVFQQGSTTKRLVIDVTYPDRVIKAQLWKAQVGRVPLFLLDTNIAENRAEDRTITGPLYGGDSEFRVRGDHARHRRRTRARAMRYRRRCAMNGGTRRSSRWSASGGSFAIAAPRSGRRRGVLRAEHLHDAHPCRGDRRVLVRS